MPVVETEFLLALRESDPLHGAALRLLKKFKALQACGVAFLELAWLLRSQGKGDREIYLALTVLKAELAEKEIREIPLTLSQLIRAHSILTQYKITFFDALMLSNIEDSSDGTVISNDEAFDVTKTIKRLPLR